MTRELTCILCPVGCQLLVDQSEDCVWVKGNRCKKGIDFATKEVIHPTRVLTTTITIREGILTRLPVMSKGEIPKEMIVPCVQKLYTVEVEAPVRIGQVILPNILDTGVDIVASRSMKTTERS